MRGKYMNVNDNRQNIALETARLLIRCPSEADAAVTVAFYKENAAHLKPWEPVRPAEFFTEEYWRARLRRNTAAVASVTAFTFYLFEKTNGAADRLVGMVSLSNIERGPFQNVRLGYKLAEMAQGKGLMQEALSEILRYAFEVLQLRRIEANVIPYNERSRSLLRRLGFREIGIDEEYLEINGAVRPHVLTALTRTGAHSVNCRTLQN